MMEDNDYKDKTYMEVLMKLRQMIATDYQQGGRFPSSREMSARLNVSLPTYGKAIERLLTEGSAYKNSNKGIFIYPKTSRKHKIGIVLGSGEESPFLCQKKILGEVLLELEKNHFPAQILQAPSKDKIQQKALFYGMDCILWILTDPPDATLFRQFGKPIFPTVLLNTNEPPEKENLSGDNIAFISRDCLYEGERRAKILLKHGARRVLYAGRFESGEEYGFFPSLRKGNAFIAKDLPMQTFHQLTHNLEKAILRDHIDTVYTEGTSQRVNFILKTISRIPEQERPQICSSYFDELPELLKKYPGVRSIGACHGICSFLVPPTIRILSDFLKKGVPLTSIQVKCFHYYRPEDL